MSFKLNIFVYEKVLIQSLVYRLQNNLCEFTTRTYKFKSFFKMYRTPNFNRCTGFKDLIKYKNKSELVFNHYSRLKFPPTNN